MVWKWLESFSSCTSQMKKLANTSPPERTGKKEEVSIATCQNTLQHARLEPAHTFIRYIVKIHWKVQTLIRNVNQITSTSVKVQLFLPGFCDTNLFVLLPAMVPNWSYYSNCAEFNARLVVVSCCSLAAWQLCRGKWRCTTFAYVFAQKDTCQPFPLEIRVCSCDTCSSRCAPWLNRKGGGKVSVHWAALTF